MAGIFRSAESRFSGGGIYSLQQYGAKLARSLDLVLLTVLQYVCPMVFLPEFFSSVLLLSIKFNINHDDDNLEGMSNRYPEGLPYYVGLGSVRD